jgi:hypothetical protein
MKPTGTATKPPELGTSRPAAERPTRRRLAIAILLAGAALAAGFVLFTTAAGADRAPEAARPLLDATHLPPLLTLPGVPVELRYDIQCAPAGEGSDDDGCDASGTVFARAGTAGPFRELALGLDPGASEGRHVARVPADIARSRRGFTYYAVLHGADGAALVLPSGGAQAPHRSLPLERHVDVTLGRHVFGSVRRADARVVETVWGRGTSEVGLEHGPSAPPVGGSSFDVDAAGNVFVLDQVNRRVLRWASGSPSRGSIPVAVDGTIADLAVAADGSMYVLEGARADRPPVIRTLDSRGATLAVTELGERTASQVRIGPAGPIVLQHPSGQWMRVQRDGRPLTGAAQFVGARPGRTLPGGDEVIVLRQGNELRVAIASGDLVRQSWQVTSETPIAEVQLAEPTNSGLLLVIRVYTDTTDEFLALVLGPRGLHSSASLASADWAETAPLSRFRVSGSSLYQLGSSPAGLVVDRFDLEVE